MAEIIKQKGLIDKRFERPPKPVYSTTAAMFSILSLALMCYASFYFQARLSDSCTTFELLRTPPATTKKRFWQQDSRTPLRTCLSGKDASNTYRKIVCLFPDVAYPKKTFQYYKCTEKPAKLRFIPFKTSALVALFGLFLELYVFSIGEQFHFKCTPTIQAIHQFWEMCYAFITSTSFFLTISLTEDPAFRAFFLVLLFVSSLTSGALLPALYFRRIKSLNMYLVVFHLTQAAIVASRLSFRGGTVVTIALVVHCICTALAWNIERTTPERSACFHVLFTIALASQYVAVAWVGNEDSEYLSKINDFLHPPKNPQLLMYTRISLTLSGFRWTLHLSKRTYQALRSMISYMVWSSMYFLLLFKRLLLENPYKLSDVYKDKPIRKISIQPYSQQHRKYMPKLLAVPSVEGPLFPETVEAFGDLRRLLDIAFDKMTTLGHFFPQAVVSTPIHDKVRMEVWEDGTNYYPSQFFSLSPTFPDRGKTLHIPPKPMFEAFKAGKLLPYLCQYGMGTTFLQMAKETKDYPFFQLTTRELGEDEDPEEERFFKFVEVAGDGKTGLVLDFRDLEQYETKPDYEPYGGVAFFTIDETNVKLKLEWVVAPKTKEKTKPDPMSGTFRRAESMIVSSMYFKTVAGKHLVEIHMTFNLLEVALHNAFDYDMNLSFPRARFNGHPLRLILYIHVFNHILAAELTVCHLVQEGAVFSQIFALTYNSLLNFITAEYNKFKYASDEDWEYRKEAMASLWDRDSVDPSFACSLTWELEYKKIFDDYARSMVDAIYGTDADVENDRYLQEFYRSIKKIFANVPRRFHGLKNKVGLARFISDTINHLCIRHEVYGTTAVSGALDPRLNFTQLPRDGGPQAVDEWRSMTFVALATAYVDFVHLLQDPENVHPNRERDLRDIFDDATPVNWSDTGAEIAPQVEGNVPDSRQELVDNMKRAFDQMQWDLRDLQTRWYRSVGQRNPPEGCENYMYFRAMPVDISTGPGY